VKAALRAVCSEVAFFAARAAGRAECSAEADEAVAESDPVFVWDEFHEIALNLDGVSLSGESEAGRDSLHVCVHHHSVGESEALSSDDIGRFSSDARQEEQMLHIPGHLAVVFGHQAGSHADDVLCFVTEKTSAVNDFFHVDLVG
jgi:hypothetical protein